MAAYTAGFMTHITCRLAGKNRDRKLLQSVVTVSERERERERERVMTRAKTVGVISFVRARN